jgi:hypothetical protein
MLCAVIATVDGCQQTASPAYKNGTPTENEMFVT